jgi:hypothetical protein
MVTSPVRFIQRTCLIGLPGSLRELLEMAQQEAVADRLISVIQSIQLAQGSGVLRVRRGEGGMMEEGVIVFVKGQVTQTIAGRRAGRTVLNWLSTWGSCRYVFDSKNEPEQPLLPVSPAGVERATVAKIQPRIPIPRSLRRPGAPQIPFSTQPLGEALRRIEHSRLSRSHRQLYLLIDGQRTIIELSHLVGKDQQEVSKALHDLERLGIIHPGGD